MKRPPLLIAGAIVAIGVGAAPFTVFASGGAQNAKQASMQQLALPTPPTTVTPLPLPAGGVAQVPGVLDPPPNAGRIGTPKDLGGIPQPFSAATMTVTNMYINLVGRDFLGIYAGVVPDSSGRGAIYIFDQNADGNASTFLSGLVGMPNSSGALSLSSVNLPYATVTDGQGHQHTFDLGKHAFTS